MDDFKKDSSSHLARFGRDKRERPQRTERAEHRPRLQRDAADGEQTRAPRRSSYNPNFTDDNRFKGGERREFGDRKPFGERKEFGDRKQYGDRKPFGERKEFGDRKPFGERKEFGDRKPYGDRKPFGERKEFGDRKPFGERKEFGDRKPYGDRKPFGERKEFGDRKPYGDRKPFGERKEFGDRKPFGERKEFGDRKPYGDRKPFGERKEFGDRKPYGDRKPFGERKSFGDRKPFADRKPAGERKEYPKYEANMTGEIRLNRYIAQSGICSRREADEYIKEGLITVNDVVVTELGTKVTSTDNIKYNDSVVKGEKKVYLLLNKPKGYVTSLDDPHADKTVMELINGACAERVYPVGRLDKNSVGVLLFTNDGDITKQLTHPSHQKKKIYQVTLDKPLTRADMDTIASGITLEDGEIFADEISYVKESKDEVGIEIHSGRNRIVRRIFEHLDYKVQKLDRVYFAGLTKKNLKRGQWRFLTPEEVERIKSGRYE